jgi:hypothetical protein
MTPSFDVHVPFEAVVQESLEARTQSALPDAELSSGLRVRRTASGYEAELRVTASHPREAKVAAVQRVETLLKLLAAGNDGFRVVISGIREVRAIDVDAPATAEHTAERLSDTVFLEEHLGVLKQKGDLAPEDAVLERLDDLPPSVRNCLDLNYLLLISDRPPVRWLLAATGLEALAVGRLGNQPRLSGLLSARRKRGLQASIDRALREAGVEDADKRARALERLLGATQERLAAHVVRYLELMGIHDVTVDEIANWWTIRGQIAHGSGVQVDVSDLNRLVHCFQTALRRAAGIEPVPRRLAESG